MARAGLSIKVEGITAIERKLLDLTANLGDQILEEAAMAAGAIIRDDAKLRAPRATGEGAKSIIVEVVEREPGRVVVGVGPDKEHFYMRFHETGVGPHLIKRGGKTIKHPGHGATPFLRPALDEKKDEAKAAAAAVIEKYTGV